MTTRSVRLIIDGVQAACRPGRRIVRECTVIVDVVETARHDSPRGEAHPAELVDRDEYEALLLERLRAEYEWLRDRTARPITEPLDLWTPF